MYQPEGEIERETERDGERETAREREREREEERKRKIEQNICMVLEGYISTHVLIVKILKGYLLKPIHITTCNSIEFLKPMLFASAYTLGAYKKTNLVETHAPACKIWPPRSADTRGN